MTLLSSFELQEALALLLALTELFVHEHTKVIALEATLTGPHTGVFIGLKLSLRDQDKSSNL